MTVANVWLGGPSEADTNAALLCDVDRTRAASFNATRLRFSLATRPGGGLRRDAGGSPASSMWDAWRARSMSRRWSGVNGTKQATAL
jgi:hypothetical protein